jgi:hypothetical protein
MRALIQQSRRDEISIEEIAAKESFQSISERQTVVVTPKGALGFQAHSPCYKYFAPTGL